jgi:hypothetical protein
MGAEDGCHVGAGEEISRPLLRDDGQISRAARLPSRHEPSGLVKDLVCTLGVSIYAAKQ